MSEFLELGLEEKLVKILGENNYLKPTPIQIKAIPEIIKRKDVIGIAQTGTGKTAAFTLPFINQLLSSNESVKSGHVRNLILAPTRELALQISENIEKFSKGLNLKYAAIFGGVNDKAQIANLQKGLDFLIATPGRLMDLTNQGHIRFMQTQCIILDEADRMLDMGFINDIRHIISLLPTNRQNLLFSATMPKEIFNLVSEFMNNPVRIEVAPESSTVDKIDQKIFYVNSKNKLSLLKAVLQVEEVKNLIVFTNTKHNANFIQENLLKSGISVNVIHGDKSQDGRTKALEEFKNGKVKVLIATDIAGRGIDIEGITHVINYDIPNNPENYIHRIGRTARAGKEGVAISFCDKNTELEYLQEIEKAINMKIEIDDSHPFHEDLNQKNNIVRPSHNRDRNSQDRGNQDRSGQNRNSQGQNRNRNQDNQSRNSQNPNQNRNPKHNSGNKKSILVKILDALNPLSWFSSGKKNKNYQGKGKKSYNGKNRNYNKNSNRNYGANRNPNYKGNNNRRRPNPNKDNS